MNEARRRVYPLLPSDHTRARSRAWAERCRRLSRVAQSGEIAALRQPLERVFLDLAHALGGDAELATGLAERCRLANAAAETELDHVALALGQAVDRFLDRARAGVRDDLVLRVGRVRGEQVAERRLAVVPDRLVEARERPGGLADLDDLVDRQLDRVGQLLLGRLAAELGRELALGAVDLALALSDVDGQPDRARRVLEPALDRLANPERGVGRELEAATPVELLGGTDQAEHALLDQVAEREPVALVLAGHRHDQPQVRVDHPVLGVDVALLDALCELDLLGGGEQRVLTHGVAEQLQRIGGDVLDLVLRLLGGGPLRDALVIAREAATLRGGRGLRPPTLAGGGLGLCLGGASGHVYLYYGRDQCFGLVI